jgi:hypothetical protein
LAFREFGGYNGAVTSADHGDRRQAAQGREVKVKSGIAQTNKRDSHYETPAAAPLTGR